MAKPRKLNGAAKAPTTKRQLATRLREALQTGGNAVQKPVRRVPNTAPAVQNPSLTRKQEKIWEKAAAFCAWNLPTLWTAGTPRQDTENRWIVPIILRYLDGYEGKLGEMAFDEARQEFTLLTDKASLAKRARVVASSRLHDQNAASPEAGT